MRIACIALDLDQTTLDAGGRLSEGNRRALEYAIGKGVHIVVASGRAFATLPPDVLAVSGIEYAVTSNGAAVYHIPSGKCLHGYTLKAASVREILRLTAQEQVTYEAFVAGRAYAEERYIRDPVSHGATPQAVAYIQSTRRPVPDIHDFICQHIGQLDSLDVVVRDQETKGRLWPLLEASVPDIYVTSSVQRLIEISHADAGKHSGVRYVLDLLGIPRECVAAFGDGDNDADMLSFVGCGVAVENAAPACRAAADFITKSHQEDGVAYGIYHILGI